MSTASATGKAAFRFSWRAAHDDQVGALGLAEQLLDRISAGWSRSAGTQTMMSGDTPGVSFVDYFEFMTQ